MSKVYMLVTVTKRPMKKRMLELYEKNDLKISFGIPANGTASSDMLDYFGLEDTEKLMIVSIATDSVWKKIKDSMENEFRIDAPGRGIAFIVPVSSVGGKKTLEFFTEGQDFRKEEESTMKNTLYELIVAIANHGHSEEVMDAARKKGAGGGTVIHAKGTGLEQAEKFLGFSIVDEKDLIFIVAKTEKKNDIMKSVMEDAGPGSEAGAIVFSLPVTDTVGMRFPESEMP